MKKKIPKRGNKEDNIWFNKDIEKAIKTRKLYNRQKKKRIRPHKKTGPRTEIPKTINHRILAIL